MRKQIAVALFILFVLSACRAAATPEAAEAAYAVVRQPDLMPGDAVPAPSGPVILTLTGQISHANAGETLQFDMETLERLGVVAYSVEDKQAEGRTAVFQGVLLSQLLAVAGVSASAATLHAIALNDYAVDIPIADSVAYPVLLATAVDGQRMPVERYGPTRIIYPYGAYEFDETIYDPRWIWQLATIDVR